MFPAVGQGALGIECRSDDETVRRTLAAIDDLPTHRAVAAERTLLAELRAGCHAPVGVFTETSGDVLTLKSVVLSPDGARCVYAESSGPVDDPAAVGRAVAAELRAQGADELINRPGS
jgi:hydroxymethylbilane synthase